MTKEQFKTQLSTQGLKDEFIESIFDSIEKEPLQMQSNKTINTQPSDKKNGLKTQLQNIKRQLKRVISRKSGSYNITNPLTKTPAKSI